MVTGHAPFDMAPDHAAIVHNAHEPDAEEMSHRIYGMLEDMEMFIDLEAHAAVTSTANHLRETFHSLRRPDLAQTIDLIVTAQTAGDIDSALEHRSGIMDFVGSLGSAREWWGG